MGKCGKDFVFDPYANIKNALQEEEQQFEAQQKEKKEL